VGLAQCDGPTRIHGGQEERNLEAGSYEHTQQLYIDAKRNLSSVNEMSPDREREIFN